MRYYAPRSYNRVEIRIESGKATIDATPRDFTAIEVAVKEIEFELAHAAHIALEVNTMRDLSKDQHEDYILEIENKLLRISKALNDQDLRDQPIRTQATWITSNVKSARLQYVAKTSLKTNEVSQRATALEALVNQQQAEIEALKLQLADKVTPSLDVPVELDTQPITASADVDLQDNESSDDSEFDIQ